MFLKKLQLTNFRNYGNIDLEFDHCPTILVGNNAVGKSNLLEAIYFLSTTKSGRVDEERELIRQGEEVTRVYSRVSSEQSDTDLEITMQNIDGQFSKRTKVNGIARRVTDYIGHFPAVIFYPSDINMVTGSPSLRRWHLDLCLAQVDSQYKRSLTSYEQILVKRNKVLKRIKEGIGKMDELEYWTGELLRDGQIVSTTRAGFLEAMNNFKTPLGNFSFEYRQSLLTKERLDQFNGREIQAAVTLVGPHRDDFILKLGERNLAHFGSRGEQRLATLVFKLAQLEYMALSLGNRPTLLLDDCFSELDAMHRAHVVEVVGRQQTIMSAVDLENLPKEFLNSARILKVENGKIVVS